MITEAFPQLENRALLRLLRRYLRSVPHMVLVAAITLASALLGWEIAAFYCYLIITLVVFFFGDDMTGAVPVFLFGYLCLSYPNNPQAFPETSLFLTPYYLLQVGYCAGVMVLLLILRTVYSLIFYRGQGAPRLWMGYVALALCYVLGGVGSRYYSLTSAAFGILEFAVIGGLYFFFRYTINWKRREGEYILRVITVMGFLVLAQIIAMYFREGVVVNGAVTSRTVLGAGWGHYNAVGCLMAVCAIPPLYFAGTKKHGWIFFAVSIVFMLGVVFTLSRGAILFGAVAYLAGVVAMFVHSKKRMRIAHAIVLGVFAVAIGVIAALFLSKIKTFFHAMLQFGAADNGRKELYVQAWQHFKSAPIFGVGWEGPPEDFTTPPMLPRFSAHDTVMQMLSTAGTLGIAAYLLHRVQTCVFTFSHPTYFKVIAFLSAIAVALISITDCHFIQCGNSALVYSALFAFIEGSDRRAGVDTRLLRAKKKE